MIRPRASANARGKKRGARRSIYGVVMILLSSSSSVAVQMLLLLVLVLVLLLFSSARVV